MDKMIERKYTVIAAGGEVGLTGEYEFHNPQRVRVHSRNNLGYGDISKLSIAARCPGFEIPGTLQVSFSLTESDDNKEDKPDTFQIGKDYFDVSELKRDFNQLEAGIRDCYLNVRDIVFRQPSDDPHKLEFFSTGGD